MSFLLFLWEQDAVMVPSTETGVLGRCPLTDPSPHSTRILRLITGSIEHQASGLAMGPPLMEQSRSAKSLSTLLALAPPESVARPCPIGTSQPERPDLLHSVLLHATLRGLCLEGQPPSSHQHPLLLMPLSLLLSPASPTRPRLLRCRPAWYDLPPPPYSSDTESLNQADLPPYRSRSGSANSASSRAASSLLSVEDTGPNPGQPGPPEGTAEPRDSMPSQGTEEV